MPYELVEDIPQETSPIERGKEVGRQIARPLYKVATRTAGAPGDILEMVNDFIVSPGVEALTGKKGTPYEETFLGKAIPTTQTRRKEFEQGLGDFLQPKNKIEAFTDDVIEDTSQLFTPGGIAKAGKKYGTMIVKNLMKSLGANFAGETTKQVSGSEEAGTYTKAGALFLTSILDQESAAKQVGKLYKEAESHVVPGTLTKATKLEADINHLERSITKGRPYGNLSPPEKFVVDQAEKIRKLITNGEIDVEQAIAQKRSLHKELATLYKEVPRKGDQKNVKDLAKRLSGFLNDTIDNYGKTNKEFYKPYKEADKAYGTLAKSNFVSNWIENNVVSSPLTHGLLHVVGGPIGGITAGTAGAALLYQPAKLVYRISQSKTLTKIYAKTVAAAANEDKVAFNKYLKQLDSAIQEDELKDRYEFVD